MLLRNNRSFCQLVLALSFAFILVLGVACTPSSSGSEDEEAQGEADMEHDEDMEDMEHDEDMEGMDHDEGGEATIPNDGATIRLLSPADHTTVKASDEFLVEVEVENFPLGEEGNHWHIEVDGDVYQMIMGGNTEWSVRGLEPGEHDISVHLSNGTHQQLEDGDSITLIVEE